MSDKRLQLSAHFYNATEFECNYKSWAFKPAAAFEIAHNLSGVAEYYRFPPITIDNETRALGMFFEHHVDLYKQPVMACYSDYSKIEKNRDLDPVILNCMRNDWAALLDLNPILEKLRVDINEPLELFDALMGVACLFNPDDIDFFLMMQRTQKSWAVAFLVGNLPDYAACADKVSAVASQPGWVASPKTLHHILDSLKLAPL